MEKLELCVNTQTPLVQFKRIVKAKRMRRGVVRLSDLKEEVDYRFSPGGVTRMVLPLLKHLQRNHMLRGAHWVSLNPGGPEAFRLGELSFHSIHLGKSRLRGYGAIKETILGRAHGLDQGGDTARDMFWTEDFTEYAHYNRLTTELMRRLDAKYDFDLFYIHDFQQIPVGHMIRSLKPKIFRWHIPLEGSSIPEFWTAPLSTYLNSYDMVVASAGKYLDALRKLGYRGRTRRIYPYVDPDDFSRPTGKDVARVGRSFGISKGDEVALVVARMDPLKGQDRAIRALAEVATERPKLKLVLVGNGSFSGSKQGLELSKSDLWRKALTRLAKDLGIADRVTFTGHVTQEQLDALYERSSFTLLPSVREGFGLVVVESWLHRRAPIVTSRAGISELVVDGKNGILIDPDDIDGVADSMLRILADGELAGKLAREGSRTARLCSVDVGVKEETKMIAELVGS